MSCNCPKTNCPRHGICDACIRYHEDSKREPHCQRKHRDCLRVRTWILAVLITAVLLSVAAVAGFHVTRNLIDRRYQFVQELEIHSIELNEIRDGRYIGRFIYGNNTYFSEVIIQSGKINEILINVETSDRNRRYVEQAEALLDEVVETQSLEIDAVCGATRSSKSILKSIENALVVGY